MKLLVGFIILIAYVNASPQLCDSNSNDNDIGSSGFNGVNAKYTNINQYFFKQLDEKLVILNKHIFGISGNVDVALNTVKSNLSTIINLAIGVSQPNSANLSNTIIEAAIDKTLNSLNDLSNVISPLIKYASDQIGSALRYIIRVVVNVTYQTILEIRSLLYPQITDSGAIKYSFVELLNGLFSDLVSTYCTILQDSFFNNETDFSNSGSPYPIEYGGGY